MEFVKREQIKSNKVVWSCVTPGEKVRIREFIHLKHKAKMSRGRPEKGWSDCTKEALGHRDLSIQEGERNELK